MFQRVSPAPRARAFLVATFVLVTTSRADAQRSHPASARRIGDVSFLNSGAPRAQPDFLRGLALLHSFMYEPAAESFRRAQRADSGFAMAYWGEALTYVHTAWRTENLAAANAVLARLAPTGEARLAIAKTPRERAYGAAVEALVAAGAPESQRVRAFSDSMRALATAYPHDVDARAFAALGGMLVNSFWPAADSAQRARAHDAAEAFALGVFREKPMHPGGAHYVIHVDDDPAYAARGLAAARAYAKIAPDADHALHMPSHIFVQLGYWDDATRSNERAWPASRSSATSHASRGEPNASWHALQWLQYSYLQQGRWHAARALIDTARAILRGAPSNYWGNADARFVVSDMIFRLAAETGEGWADVREAVRNEGTDLSSQRASHFTRAAAYHAAVAGALIGDTLDAHAFMERLRARGDSTGASEVQRARDAMSVAQLEALIAIVRADSASALAAWERARDAESRVPPLGPPIALLSHEWLGDLLLQRGQARDAAAAYERALQFRPGRAHALIGLERAQRAAGELGAATGTQARLRRQWHLADGPVAKLMQRQK